MKYTILPYDDTQAHGLNRYIVDEVSDIETLPAYVQPGSKAIVANSGDVYLLNNEHKWIKQPTSSGGSSGGMSENEIEEILTEKGYATQEFVTAAIPDLSAYAKKNNPVLTGNLSLGTSVTSDGGFGAVGTGLYVKATGRSAHAEGQSSTASGWTAHAEGLQTKASGDYSHAEGYGSSMGNVAVGNVTYIVGASGSAGHSEGENTIAAGNASHAEGQGTVAIGAYTHVGGTYNIIDSDFSDFTEWVSGTSYNVGDVVKVTTTNSIKVYNCLTANSDETFTDNKWNQNYIKMQYAEIIGNGADNSHRSNARTLDWDGNEVLAGGLTVNSNSGITIGSTTLTEQILGVLIQPLIIEVNQNGVLSETWEDIFNAFALGRKCIIANENNGNIMITNVLSVVSFNNTYCVSTILMDSIANFTTSSPSGYPSTSGDTEEDENSPINLRFIYDENGEAWNWTANNPNFTVSGYISAHLDGQDVPEIYAAAGPTAQFTHADVEWNHSQADSDALVISNIPFENDRIAFVLWDNDGSNTANVVTSEEAPK